MSTDLTDVFRSKPTAETDPERFARLPKWAQDRITKLERDVEYAHDKLRAGPENSNTFSDVHSATPRPLGTDPTVEFVLGDGREDKIACRIDGDVLYVNGGHGLIVLPQSSNAFSIGLRKR